MIPFKDDNPHRQFPIVTYFLIGVNLLVFLYQLYLPARAEQTFVLQYGAVPVLIIHGQNLYGIITSMFLHGGFMHFAGNMLYLHVFGDNVEALCGHFRFFVFYLVCGLLAFASHFVFNLSSEIPMIGASGAISGVLGAYALRFPRARVHVLVPLFIWIWRVFQIPAALVLGFWFFMQIFSGVFSGAQGGVAWFAHIGGFVAGMILIRSLEQPRYFLRY